MADTQRQGAHRQPRSQVDIQQDRRAATREERHGGAAGPLPRAERELHRLRTLPHRGGQPRTYLDIHLRQGTLRLQPGPDRKPTLRGRQRGRGTHHLQLPAGHHRRQARRRVGERRVRRCVPHQGDGQGRGSHLPQWRGEHGLLQRGAHGKEAQRRHRDGGHARRQPIPLQRRHDAGAGQEPFRLQRVRPGADAQRRDVDRHAWQGYLRR